MPDSEIVAIAAVARNGVIGAGGDIPWRIPEDWQRFKRLTMGGVLVMGRKTFESIGRALPGRTTVVITRDPQWESQWQSEGVQVAAGVPEALRAATTHAPAPVFVAGGGEIYRAAWESFSRLEITEVHAEPAGDVTFPDIPAEQWEETTRAGSDGYDFVTYRRRSEAK